MSIRTLFCLALLPFLFACNPQSTESTEAAPEPSASDWIEIPMPDGVFTLLDGVQHSRFEITVPPASWLEVDIRMEKGEQILYRWDIVPHEGAEDGAQVYTEFHGHPPREEGRPGQLMYYRNAEGSSEAAHFVAPFSGEHAWYIQNDNLFPVILEFQISGQFDQGD